MSKDENIRQLIAYKKILFDNAIVIVKQTLAIATKWTKKKNDKFLQQNLKSKGRATQGVGDSNSSFTEGKKMERKKEK